MQLTELHGLPYIFLFLFIDSYGELLHLLEGHTCCNRPMSKRSLGKLAFGYDHIYEQLNDSRKIFVNDCSSESGFISMFTHRENESVWTKSMKALAKKIFSSECK